MTSTQIKDEFQCLSDILGCTLIVTENYLSDDGNIFSIKKNSIFKHSVYRIGFKNYSLENFKTGRNETNYLLLNLEVLTEIANIQFKLNESGYELYTQLKEHKLYFLIYKK